METKKFVPDEDGIRQRTEIKPFGRATAYEVVEPEVVKFVLSSAVEPLVTETTPSGEAAVVSSYIPPVLHKAAYNTGNTDVTVRVSNIPKNLSNKDVYNFLMSECGKCFYKCNLAFDKETHESRGIAYVTCDSKEKATKFAHQVMTVVIDNFKLGAEILENR